MLWPHYQDYRYFEDVPDVIFSGKSESVTAISSSSGQYAGCSIDGIIGDFLKNRFFLLNR
jgi:hypothetical protein